MFVADILEDDNPLDEPYAPRNRNGEGYIILHAEDYIKGIIFSPIFIPIYAIMGIIFVIGKYVFKVS